MAIPDFQTIMLPLLQLAGDGNEHSMREAREKLAGYFRLNEEEKSTLLPSGRVPLFANRVAWAKVYLDRAGLLNTTSRGIFQITNTGKEVLADSPQRITVKFLARFPEFREFRQRTKSDRLKEKPAIRSEKKTLDETIEDAYNELRKKLADELLDEIKRQPPEAFEKLVVDLLKKMGYGGVDRNAVHVTGKPGDEGIDGIIYQDRLGIEVIYLQAKRWAGTVGRPEIQKFVGALHGKRARKGVFLTTGSFSRDALAYVEQIEPRVILLDGNRLAEYMIEFGLGVATTHNYPIKRIDSDYFSESEV